MNAIMNTFGRAVKPLFGTGVGRVPGVIPIYRWLWRNFGPRGIVKVQTNGGQLKVDCRDWAVAPSLVFGHIWEPNETETVKHFVKEGMTVADIGAHIGYYSVLMSKIVGGKGKVFSFEPSPDTRVLLEQNIDDNSVSNVELYPYAISDSNSQSKIYMDKVSPASNTMWNGNGKLFASVETRTLDSVLGERHLDFIKIDIEGGESRALQGMEGTILNNPSLMMMTEVYPDGLKAAGSSLAEYINQLLRYFDLYLIVKQGAIVPTRFDHIKRNVEKAGSINLLCKRKVEC